MIGGKRFNWLALLLAGFLAIGMMTGCDKTTEEDNGTDLGVAIPDAMQGTWILFAAQDNGEGAIYDISSYVTFEISLEAHTFSMNSDAGPTSGAAGYEERSEGDFLMLLEDGTEEIFELEVLTYDDNIAQIWMVDGTEQQLWVMARGNNLIAGVITDSDGMPLAGATVTATQSFGSETGSCMTGDLGVYIIPNLTTSAYDVSVSLDGYEDELDFVATSGLEPTFLSFSLTEGSGGGGGGTDTAVMTIELGWGQNTYDYDLKMKTPEIESSTYTVSYASPGSMTSAPYAYHYGDETDGPGPEKIAIAQLSAGTYRVYGYWWDNSFADGECETVFKNASGTVVETVTAPTGTGDYWYIADIDGATGNITVVNTVQDSPPTISERPDQSKVREVR